MCTYLHDTEIKSGGLIWENMFHTSQTPGGAKKRQIRKAQAISSSLASRDCVYTILNCLLYIFMASGTKDYLSLLIVPPGKMSLPLPLLLNLPTICKWMEFEWLSIIASIFLAIHTFINSFHPVQGSPHLGASFTDQPVQEARVPGSNVPPPRAVLDSADI